MAPEQPASPMVLDTDGYDMASVEMTWTDEENTVDGQSDIEAEEVVVDDQLEYLQEEIEYEDQNQNQLEVELTAAGAPSMNNYEVRREVYSLFLSAYRTKFGSTDKEMHSLLHFLRLVLADTVQDPSTCNLPKSFKTIEKEFQPEQNDIVQYTVCGKCHTLYPSAQDVSHTMLFI